jgi:hypothetical protein
VGVAESSCVELELRLLQPATRADRAAVERLLHPDFREIGVSGRLWDRAAIVDSLADEPGQGAMARNVEAREVADGVVLVTYDTERARRTSLWVRTQDGWRVLFHQGTPLPARP